MDTKIKNLIIISVDNLRVDCINANPNKELLKKYGLKVKLKTPTLDWFVDNGIFFNNCITTAPYTTNAHASILTGQWPYRHGIIDFFRNKLESPTILEILKENGFSTLFQTDYPFILGPNLGFDKGVDLFVKEKEEISFAWLKKNRNKRKACFFHFANVHDPYGFFNLHWGGDEYKKKVEYLLNKYNISSDKKVLRGQHFITSDFTEEELILKQNYKKILDKMYGLELYSEIMDLYIEGINYFERKRFGPFIKKLKDLELFEDSLIIVLGDHGEAWDKNNKGHYRGNLKDGLIDDMIKVPLIFYGSSLPKNRLINNQIRTIDIAPTILSLLDINFNKQELDGFDLSAFKNIPKDLVAHSQIWASDSALVTIFMNKTKQNGGLVKSEFDSYLKVASVRQKNYKLVQNHSKKKEVIKTRLFNIENKKRRCFRKDKIINNLSKELDRYNDLIYKKIAIRINNVPNFKRQEIEEQLRSLGYNV